MIRGVQSFNLSLRGSILLLHGHEHVGNGRNRGGNPRLSFEPPSARGTRGQKYSASRHYLKWLRGIVTLPLLRHRGDYNDQPPKICVLKGDLPEDGLENLVQHLMSCMVLCWRNYLGHSNLLHCSVPIYNFVAGDRFVNPGENLAYHVGGISMWTTLQGKGDIGVRMALADAELSTINRRNDMVDQTA